MHSKPAFNNTPICALGSDATSEYARRVAILRPSHSTRGAPLTTPVIPSYHNADRCALFCVARPLSDGTGAGRPTGIDLMSPACRDPEGRVGSRIDSEVLGCGHAAEGVAARRGLAAPVLRTGEGRSHQRGRPFVSEEPAARGARKQGRDDPSGNHGSVAAASRRLGQAAGRKRQTIRPVGLVELRGPLPRSELSH